MALFKRMAVMIVVSMLLAQTAYAHHLWIMKNDDGFAVARGHAPDKTEDYNPESVKEIRAFDRDGNPLPITQKITKNRVILEPAGAISMITVWCDWGYRVNTTQGKKLMTRQEAEKAGFRVVQSFFSTQFAKTLFEACKGVNKNVGLPLEIVPLKDPLTLLNGEELPVQLFWEGKPLSNVAIISGDGQEAQTDPKGVAALKIPSKGMQIFSAAHKVSEQSSAEIDYHLYTTFLSFEVKE
ncbi:DUF4198 domain-containing protein [bacterium]|nr:DUF4198 domain-containing protein [bacterium]